MIAQKTHTIEEFNIGDRLPPVTGVVMSGKEVFKMSDESEWEIDTVYTDYVLTGDPHHTFVVVFKRKDEE